MEHAQLIAELRKKASEYREAAERFQVNVHANVGAAQACESFITELVAQTAKAAGGKKPLAVRKPPENNA